MPGMPSTVSISTSSAGVIRRPSVKPANSLRYRGNSIRLSAYEADEARTRVLERTVEDLEELITPPQPATSHISPTDPLIKYGLGRNNNNNNNNNNTFLTY
jgi:hypothetical protein